MNKLNSDEFQLTQRQLDVLGALHDGGQLHLETRRDKRHRKSNGWYLHHRGRIVRVNDNTVWSLRDREFIEKRDYYAAPMRAWTAICCNKDVGNVPNLVRGATTKNTPIVANNPKQFKRMELHR